MKQLKILLAASEAVPFSKTGGLADAAGSLPLALSSLGEKIAVFLPYYRLTKNKDFGIKSLQKGLKAEWGNWNSDFSLYHCKKENVDFYFIDKKEYFNRDFIYGTPLGDYPDNAERFGFFANSVLSSAQALNFKPDIIHCNDWHTALIPFYLKHKLANQEFFKNTKILFTIHNLAYQGIFPKEVISKLGIGCEFFTPESLEFYGKLNFIKSGILYSDAITTVSRGYAKEILTKKFGCGLEGLLALRKNNLYGITNGADYTQWNPKTDKLIKVNYGRKNLRDKLKCKKDLLKQIRLSLSLNAPLLGMVSRLTQQKGIDIIINSILRVVTLGCGLVILGVGDEKYHKKLLALAKKYPQNIAVRIGFDNKLAHRIEAGCDMFLMPSRYEPCGLSQLYSLKYGTIPIVRAVGGLNDTIIDYGKNPDSGNGFKFSTLRPDDFIGALKRAISVYKNKKEWKNILLRIMKLDFSWEESAKEYIKVYQSILR